MSRIIEEGIRDEVLMMGVAFHDAKKKKVELGCLIHGRRWGIHWGWFLARVKDEIWRLQLIYMYSLVLE